MLSESAGWIHPCNADKPVYLLKRGQKNTLSKDFFEKPKISEIGVSQINYVELQSLVLSHMGFFHRKLKVNIIFSLFAGLKLKTEVMRGPGQVVT